MFDSLLPIETESPEETRAVGRSLVSQFVPGSIVALYGELGTGKTQLVKGICEGLGIDPDTVTSPTFTIINEYRAGTVDVYHFDAYRLKKVSDFIALGYEDYFFGSGITVIEWPERVEDFLPRETIRVRLSHAGPESRRIECLGEMELS